MCQVGLCNEKMGWLKRERVECAVVDVRVMMG